MMNSIPKHRFVHTQVVTDWSMNNNQFICVCHDSRFTTIGKLWMGLPMLLSGYLVIC